VIPNLAPAIEPGYASSSLAKTLGLSVDEYGFFKEETSDVSSVISSKPGVFIAGCAQGAKNIQDSVSQASAAVGKILSMSKQEEQLNGKKNRRLYMRMRSKHSRKS